MSAHEIVKQFTHGGLRCFVVFNFNGIHCGYVELPPRHWLWGRSDAFDECLSGLTVHGGITYSERELPGDLPSVEGCWYLGFDCNHHMDARDTAEAVRRGLISQEDAEERAQIDKTLGRENKELTFRDARFVEAELRALVDQFGEYRRAVCPETKSIGMTADELAAALVEFAESAACFKPADLRAHAECYLRANFGLDVQPEETPNDANAKLRAIRLYLKQVAARELGGEHSGRGFSVLHLINQAPADVIEACAMPHTENKADALWAWLDLLSGATMPDENGEPFAFKIYPNTYGPMCSFTRPGKKPAEQGCEDCAHYVGPCTDGRGGHICLPRPDIERHLGDLGMARSICADYTPKTGEEVTA